MAKKKHHIEICMPLDLLKRTNKLYPGVYREIEQAKEAAAQSEMVKNELKKSQGRPFTILTPSMTNRYGFKISKDIDLINALDAWREFKAIYRFDPDMVALMRESEPIALNSSAFDKLPFPSVCCELNDAMAAQMNTRCVFARMEQAHSDDPDNPYPKYLMLNGVHLNWNQTDRIANWQVCIPMSASRSVSQSIAMEQERIAHFRQTAEALTPFKEPTGIKSLPVGNTAKESLDQMQSPQAKLEAAFGKDISELEEKNRHFEAFYAAHLEDIELLTRMVLYLCIADPDLRKVQEAKPREVNSKEDLRFRAVGINDVGRQAGHTYRVFHKITKAYAPHLQTEEASKDPDQKRTLRPHIRRGYFRRVTDKATGQKKIVYNRPTIVHKEMLPHYDEVLKELEQGKEITWTTTESVRWPSDKPKPTISILPDTASDQKMAKEENSRKESAEEELEM